MKNRLRLKGGSYWKWRGCRSCRY